MDILKTTPGRPKFFLTPSGGRARGGRSGGAQHDAPRILILGGYGRVGQEVARYLLKATDAKLVLSSRTPRPVPHWMAPASRARADITMLDVFDHHALLAECMRASLVINCVGPSGIVGDRVAVACKQARVPLVDAGGYDPLLRSLEQAEENDPTPVPLVINVGLLPGLSGLFPQWLLDVRGNKQAVDELDVCYVGRDAWTYHSAWDIVSSLGGFGVDRGCCYLSGREIVRVPMRKATRRIAFPDPIGKVSAMLIHAEEIARLAQQRRINTVRVYGANIGPRATLVCMLAKILRLHRSPERIATGARWLARASARDMRTLEPAYGIHVDLRYRDGSSDSATLTLADTYRATGTVIGITAHMLLEGHGPGPGVFLLHDAVQSDRFMQCLRKEGLLEIHPRPETAGMILKGVTA
ncbi:saccharopine dehydrogenase NADP-binding domain-containing protein [Burkholderia guangdongensis]|uniref:saccharopine dehydrogenase NADP-binding domain-containing protein n=1 Tax=Burkholderia guangdongensis TaxID=1792500 RepID=UPI0015C75310|nr:saccharopine dehydrogenase NADP-binding domain-containing protein [Burkholderia guangdongensis]